MNRTNEQAMNAPITDDTHSDYQVIKSQADASMERGVWSQRFEPRFVPWASREMRCDLPRQAIDCLSEGKHFMSYRGLPLGKDPLDMVLYQTLFFELQPRTIIELGAYTGASALWMSDTCQALDLDTQVIAVDIDVSLVDDLPRQQAAIQFLEGDCNEIQQVFPAQVLQDLPHPLILIDDAHVNVEGVYQHFHDHALRPGDYLLVEDTIPWIPGSFGNSASDQDWGDWKFKEIQEFFNKYTDAYRVDRYFTDFFGYNGTWNWNGFVKRVH